MAQLKLAKDNKSLRTIGFKDPSANTFSFSSGQIGFTSPKFQGSFFSKTPFGFREIGPAEQAFQQTISRPQEGGQVGQIEPQQVTQERTGQPIPASETLANINKPPNITASKILEDTGIPGISGQQTQQGLPAQKFLDQGFGEGDVVNEGGRQFTITPGGELRPLGEAIAAGAVPASSRQQVVTPSGVNATEVLSSLGIEPGPTSEDIATSVMNDPGFQLLSDQLESAGIIAEAQNQATKDFLERKYEQDKTDLELLLSKKGIGLGPFAATQVRALATELAASKLGADRKLAGQLLDINFDLRKGIMDSVADIVEQASKKEDKATAQLNKVGLAVVEGKLIPTLAAQAQQERANEPSIRTFTDENGDVTALDIKTNTILWKQPGIGRAGTAGININSRVISDPATGAPSVIEVTNKRTGQVEYRDVETGEPVSPSDVQIKDPPEIIEVFIDEMMKELLDEGIL
jgi:hypothetical protein